MRLHVDRWFPSSRTALELIPGRRVRATARYFRAGHLLLDWLIHSLQIEGEAQAIDLPAGDNAGSAAVRPGPGSADPRDLPQPTGGASGASVPGLSPGPRAIARFPHAT
jgi:hypothetical protein